MIAGAKWWCKCIMMSVCYVYSHQLCEKYLQLLFTVLEKSADTAVRANTIVAAGDLAFRYPNLTEPWTPHLYARWAESQWVEPIPN